MGSVLGAVDLSPGAAQGFMAPLGRSPNKPPGFAGRHLTFGAIRAVVERGRLFGLGHQVAHQAGEGGHRQQSEDDVGQKTRGSGGRAAVRTATADISRGLNQSIQLPS